MILICECLETHSVQLNDLVCYLTVLPLCVAVAVVICMYIACKMFYTQTCDCSCVLGLFWCRIREEKQVLFCCKTGKHLKEWNPYIVCVVTACVMHCLFPSVNYRLFVKGNPNINFG